MPPQLDALFAIEGFSQQPLFHDFTRKNRPKECQDEVHLLEAGHFCPLILYIIKNALDLMNLGGQT